MLPNLAQLNLTGNPFLEDEYFPKLYGQDDQVDLTTVYNIRRFIIKKNKALWMLNGKEFNRAKMESTVVSPEQVSQEDQEQVDDENQEQQDIEEAEFVEGEEGEQQIQPRQTTEEPRESAQPRQTQGTEKITPTQKEEEKSEDDSDEPQFGKKTTAPPQMVMPTSNEPPPKVRKRKVIAPPNLDQLLYSIECANNNHRYAGDHCEDLSNDVDILIEKLEMIDEHFAKNMSDDTIFQKMESFMQNIQLLIDNHVELIDEILEILAKLTIIAFHDFGLMCFDTLRDLSFAGREFEELVIEVVQTHIIKNLRQPDPTEIPVTLLLGLHSMIMDTEQSDLLTPMYELSFPVWLKEYCRILDDAARLKQPMEDNCHYDSIICLLALSVKDNQNNVMLVLEKGLYMQITRILKQTQPKDMRYIQVLEIIAACANEEEELATIFLRDNVHKPLLKSIKKDMEVFNKNGGTLFTDESRETITEQMKKYQTMAAEIKTLGGLLQANMQPHEMHKKNEILNDPVVASLIAIIGNENATDPILLTAICTFGKDFLETTEICHSRKRMEPFAKKMKDLMFIIPYLGFKKYAKLLQMTRKYRDAEQQEAKVTDSGAIREEGVTHEMPSELESTVDLDAAKEKAQEKILKSLEELDDPIACQLFVSIIELIKFICLQGQTNEQNKLFDEMSEALNNLEESSGVDGMSRENALFQCLKVPDDPVKVTTVECLFTINIDELDTNEISQIVSAMAQIPDISVGEAEIVLSTIYWIQTKFVQGDIEKADSVKIFQTKFGNFCVQEALRILCNNLERETHAENDEDRQKYSLSLSILNFIKSSSDKPLMQKNFSDKSEIFKQILIYEDLRSSPRINRVPIDIENSLIGRNMSTLIETIIGVQTLQPYSDVSLRVIMKMADCLMHRHFVKYYMIDEEKDTLDELLKFQEKIYKKKKQDERKYWVDKHPRFFKNLDKDQKIELHTQHYNFTQSNGIALLRMFLMPKFPVNEQYTKFLIDDCFDETKQFDSEGRPTGLGPDIYEETGILDQRFQNKYMGKDDKQLRRVYFNRQKKKRGGNQVEQEADEKERDIKDAATNALFQENAVRSNKYEFKQGQQFNEVGIECLETRLDGNSGDLKEERYQLLRDRDLEERHRREDPEEGEILIPKDRRFDGFLNKDLRSLTIAAYLRCLFASIEYAPSVALRKSAIQNVSDPLVFRGITQLCDSTDWDEDCNLGAKYLRIVRHVLKLDYNVVSDSSESLLIYETVSTVISKALSKIVNKMKNDILLTEFDVITSYEISLTFFTIVNQSNNFIFSTNDIFALHLANEEKLFRQAALDKENKGKKPVIFKLNKEEEFGLLAEANQSEDDRKKCSNVPSKGNKIDDFKISLTLLRNKRTIQQKIVEFMILKIFQKQSIFSLIEILFKDMNEDYKDFEPDLEEDDNNEESKMMTMTNMQMTMQQSMVEDEDMQSGSQQEEDPDQEGMDVMMMLEQAEEIEEEEKKQEEEEDDEADDAINQGVDIEEYMGVKGVLNIERIKDIVGEIMNSCQDLKYEILENIMKGVVFQEMKLRESFMQEILNAADTASYRNALETFIFHNQLSVNKYFSPIRPPGQFDREIYRERIIEYSNCDVNNKPTDWLECDVSDPIIKAGYLTPNENSYQRLFILVTQGIIIMKNLNTKRQCQNCPLSKFCPEGPKQVFCLKYEDIETVVKFPQLPQRMVIIYTLHNYDEEFGNKIGTIRFQMTLDIPTFTKCAKLYRQLISILELVTDDRAFRKEKDQLTDKEKLVDHDYDISYSDLLSQWELRQILKLAMDQEVKKKDTNNSTFISASLQSCSIISDEFFNEFVKDKFDQFFGINPILQPGDPKKVNKTRNLGDEDVQQIVDSVLIGIIGNYFIILKESWENWHFIENQSDLKKYKKEWIEEYDIEKFKEKLAQEEEEEIPKLEDIGVLGEDQDRQETIRQMDLYCRPRCSNLFQLISIVDIQNIQNLFIHKGKDPSIEIKCFGDQKHTIRIKFTGDMERQTFLSSMLDCWKGKDDESEKSEEAESDTDSDDVQKQTDSDEDIVDGQIYD